MIATKSDLLNLKKKKVFFFDLDGTLYLGNRAFDGVVDVLKWLKREEKYFFLLSNNSSLSTSDYLAKLNKFKFGITEKNLILSQHPTISYLKTNHYKKIFLMGTQSLKKEFVLAGFELTEKDPEILVLAFDQELTYERLSKAAQLLQKNIPYIATHPDDRCPTENGYIPDAGGIAELLFKATERRPLVFGKPNKEMLLFKLNELKIDPSEAVMFGDRLYTDIRMGLDAKITTCCVLSGESNLEMIQNSEFKPHYILNGVWELLPA